VTNNHSITVIDEHCGHVFFSKWNPVNGRRFCATGGAGDYFVDVWDFDTIRNQTGLVPAVTARPLMQLRHISVTKSDAEIPPRDSEDHFISSIQWSHSGEKLLTSAYDNIARVWNLEGKLMGLFRSQSRLMYSAWNKNDTLIASGGENTNLLIWNPATVVKEPVHKLPQPGEIVDVVWQSDTCLAAASQQEIYYWSIDRPEEPLMIWEGHQNMLESIKWDQKGLLLASSAANDSQLMIWTPKSK